MTVTTRLVSCHILLNCCAGPVKKKDPHKASTFPMVTLMTSGTGLPPTKSFMRKKNPKLSKHPHIMHVANPNKRSFQDKSGKNRHHSGYCRYCNGVLLAWALLTRRLRKRPNHRRHFLPIYWVRVDGNRHWRDPTSWNTWWKKYILYTSGRKAGGCPCSVVLLERLVNAAAGISFQNLQCGRLQAADWWRRISWGWSMPVG
jgi:hypothetical protein